MNVHQLSIAYVPEQDRILARVNTREGRELQCWLTRRLALGVAPMLERALAEQAARRGGVSLAHLASMDELARKAVARFQTSETLNSADFATPYKTPQTAAPLLETPLLATEVNLSAQGNGQLRFEFMEKLAGEARHRSFQMALSESLVQAFAHLLERAVLKSQWRDASEKAAAPAATADLPEGLDKPVYLN